MKHSIRMKITLLLTIMVIMTILITWIINSAFLPSFYTHSKVNMLNDVYRNVADIYKNNGEYNLSDENTILVERLETKYDVKVYVFNSKHDLIFPISANMGKREKAKTKDIEKVFFGFRDPYMEYKKTLKESQNYVIRTYYNKQMNSSNIILDGMFTFSVQEANSLGEFSGSSDHITKVPEESSGSSNPITKVPNITQGASGDATDNSNDFGNSSEDTSGANNNIQGNTKKPPNNLNKPIFGNTENKGVIRVQSNYESITTSVAIANKFLAFVGIIAAIIGTIAMFLISKKFTKPILDLSGIAKKMTDLNFEIKYKVTTDDEIGELGRCINILSDKLETTILELKQANNELMTDIQRKTEIDEMRKEFLSNVSHELKTPIALIQGYAEGLKEDVNDDEESRDYYCEVIMDEANKMNNMVKKLLSLNELEFGNNQVNFDRFDIVVLIKSVLSSTEILFKQKEVTLHFDQIEPVYVWADEFLIEQVVTNYISNALNHVNGPKIIEIKLILRGDTVRVAVFNTGDNIREDEIDKIWIKFYKIDKARTREYGGSGIGLSIVKAIMNSHNKECGVINRAIGVEFWFELDTKS